MRYKLFPFKKGFFNNSSFRRFETAAGRSDIHPGWMQSRGSWKEEFWTNGAGEAGQRKVSGLLRLVIGCACQVVEHGELSPVFRGATPKSHRDRESGDKSKQMARPGEEK